MSFCSTNGFGYDSYFGFAHEGNGGSPCSFSTHEFSLGTMYLTPRNHSVFVATSFFLYGRLFHGNCIIFDLKTQVCSIQKRR